MTAVLSSLPPYQQLHAMPHWLLHRTKTVPLAANTGSSALYTSALTTARADSPQKQHISPYPWMLALKSCHLLCLFDSACNWQAAKGEHTYISKTVIESEGFFLCRSINNMSRAPVPTKIVANKIHLYCC